MKKYILSVLMVICLALAGCAGENQAQQEVQPQNDGTIYGKFTVSDVRTDIEDAASVDGLLAGTLSSYFKKSMALDFKEDGTGSIGDKPCEFIVENNTLRLTVEGNKTYVLTWTREGDELVLEYKEQVKITANK